MGRRRGKREPPPTPFAVVEAVLKRYLPNLDVQVCEAMLAAVVASQLGGPPVWLELVGPPSSGKTVLLEPLEGILGGTLVSKLTPQTFLSGSRQRGGGDPSLLTRLGDRPFLLIKELSSLLEGNPYGRGDIYAQLREIYDGSFAREYGNGLRRTWKGKATVLMGITPAIDRHEAFDGQLGERCLKIRFSCPDEVPLEDLALAAVADIGSEATVKEQLHDAYAEAIQGAVDGASHVELSKGTLRKISYLAAFAATVRTHVERDQYLKGRPVVLPPAPEGPFRIMKNLVRVAKALAALWSDTDLVDLSLIKRLAFDCMPEPRRSILLRLIRCHQDGVEPVAQDLVGIVGQTATYAALEDLEHIGVIVKSPDAGAPATKGKPAKRYRISEQARRWLEQSGFFPEKSKGEGFEEGSYTGAPLECAGKRAGSSERRRLRDDSRHYSTRWLGQRRRYPLRRRGRR